MESSARSDSRLRRGWVRPPETAARATATDRACRLVNVVMALVGLVVAAPLMLAIAILVSASSSGSVLYTQKRVGRDRRRSDRRSDRRAGHRSRGHDHRRSRGRDRDGGAGGRDGGPPAPEARDRRGRDRGGRIFTIYKFRTMYDGAGEDQVWARPDDERVTPVGRVLRKLHLDELPQLYNVLRGDMNVVGPRPEQPEIFSEIVQEMPTYRLRQRVRPGITGWAQLHQHYDRDLEDVRRKLELDLEYIERRSALQDLKIALRTVPAVLTEDADGW